MFEGIKQFLEGSAQLAADKTGQPTPRDLKVCTTALLVKIAKSDSHFSEPEVRALVSSLAKQFSLPDHESGELIEIADFLIRDNEKSQAFLEVINEKFEKSQKLTILGMLWKVMLADGLVNQMEANVASQMTAILGLDAGDIKKARQLAESGGV